MPTSKLHTLIVALFVLVLAASAPNAVRAMDFTDAAGRHVVIPDHIQRVMAAGPPAQVLIYAVAPGKMVGWVRAPGESAKAFLLPAVRDLPAHGRITGKDGGVDPKAIQALKPDLIVDVGDVTPAYAALADRVQAATGIPYVLLDGQLAATPATIRTLASFIGDSAGAEPLAAFAEGVLSASKAAQNLPAQPTVYYAHNGDGLETALPGSINAEVIEAAGARNAAAPLGKGGFAKATIDQIAAWNPDMILALDPDLARLLVTDKAWAGVAATRQNHVLNAPDLPFGWIDTPPGVNRLIGVMWLIDRLHPSAGMFDLADRTRQYYHLFYHVDLSDEQVQHLLR